ncbi:MAG: hypothetical protein IH945_03210 [Armatimonadetes bacterium]|nr:hypothetical protein [Armatimonadota bacterium]
MPQERNAFKLGLTALTMLALFVAVLVFLAGRVGGETQRVVVRFPDGTVLPPLANGSDVHFGGRTVGHVVGLWLKAYRSGELLDIYPATTAIESSPGVYFQIQEARQELIRWAKLAAKKRKSEGDFAAAAFLYADILELANIAKYSEFGALSSSSVVQTGVLQKLIELSPELSESQHEELLSRINGLHQPNRSLAHTMNRMSVIYRSDLAREGRSTAVIEVTRNSRTLASAADVDQLRIDEWRQLSDIDRSFAPLYTLSRLAQYHQVKFIEAHERAVSALSARPDGTIS